MLLRASRASKEFPAKASNARIVRITVRVFGKNDIAILLETRDERMLLLDFKVVLLGFSSCWTQVISVARLESKICVLHVKLHRIEPSGDLTRICIWTSKKPLLHYSPTMPVLIILELAGSSLFGYRLH